MIQMFDYRRGLPELEDRLRGAFEDVLHSGSLILGQQTQAFENEFAAWAGARHCVAVTSGTMAIYLALRAVQIGAGDEVITVANTCAPTIAAIRMTGAEVVFVDVDPQSLMMDPTAFEQAIGPRTRAVVPVHLWGCAVDLDLICELAKRHGLAVVEDCAQATGTRHRDRQVGTFGALGCFSFYPTKNLGAYGDAGAVLTDDDQLADRLRRLRMYGYDGSPVATLEGCNARINELQAALLRIKLPHLDRWNSRRRAIAARYQSELRSVSTPACPTEVEHCYHQYVIQHPERGLFTAKLDAAGVQWGIHYKTPVHLMPAYKGRTRPLPVTERACQEIVSIPVHEYLTDDEVAAVIRAVNA